MKIDMTAPILGLDGKVLDDGAGGQVLLRTVVQGALLATAQGDQGMDGAKKARMFGLALSANSNSVDWPVEDIALVKDRIGRVSTPLAVGRAYELLDPPADDQDR